MSVHVWLAFNLLQNFYKHTHTRTSWLAIWVQVAFPTVRYFREQSTCAIHYTLWTIWSQHTTYLCLLLCSEAGREHY